MSNGRIIDRLRRYRGALVFIILVWVATCSFLTPDDRATPPIADERPRVTVYDCDKRPGGEAVVRPNAEPRDFLRMSGCEMFFWNSEASPSRDAK
jgi:hypothetical protein